MVQSPSGRAALRELHGDASRSPSRPGVGWACPDWDGGLLGLPMWRCVLSGPLGDAGLDHRLVLKDNLPGALGVSVIIYAIFSQMTEGATCLGSAVLGDDDRGRLVKGFVRWQQAENNDGSGIAGSEGRTWSMSRLSST